MHGRVDGVNLFGDGLRNKVDDPDIVPFLAALVIDGVDGVVHVVRKFPEIILRNPSEPEPDVLKMKDGAQIVVQIGKRRDPGPGFLQGGYPLLQGGFLLVPRLQVGGNAGDGVESLIQGNIGKSCLPAVSAILLQRLSQLRGPGAHILVGISLRKRP